MSANRTLSAEQCSSRPPRSAALAGALPRQLEPLRQLRTQFLETELRVRAVHCRVPERHRRVVMADKGRVVECQPTILVLVAKEEWCVGLQSPGGELDHDATDVVERKPTTWRVCLRGEGGLGGG